MTPLTYWLFGAKTQQQKKFLKEIIRGTDKKFLKWAIDKILSWKNNAKPKNLVTIHGTNDRILHSHDPNFEIKDGGHLMILDKHEEVTSILRSVIDKTR